MPARPAPPGRAVVVGAGHNGLVCAIALARAGCEVTVVEQAPGPGGATGSAQATLPGFVHDQHAAFFPQARCSPAIGRLPLADHGLRWITPPVAMAHPFEDGAAIALHQDLDATAAELERAAAGAGRAWRELVEGLWPHREALVGAALGRFPPLLASARLGAGLGRGSIELARRLLAPAAALGRELFDAPRPAAWLCGSVGHTDLSPAQSGTGAIAFGLLFLAHLVSWPFPEGGAVALTGALVSLLREAGGELRCSTPVSAIELGRGRVRGVRTAAGELISADAVVTTVGPAPLLTLLPDGALGGRVTRRLANWRYGIGTFKLDLALSGPVPWPAASCRQAAVIHLGGSMEELLEAPLRASLGEVPPRPMLVIGQQSLHDAHRAPPGRHTLYVYTRLPSSPHLSDAEVAELIERRIELFAPGFRELILARATRGPRQQQAENPALVGGDLAAGSVALDQMLVFRPAPELVRYRTPVEGLYLAGASVHPGPGVHGVSGEGAARAVLADRRPVPRAARGAIRALSSRR